MSTPRLSLGVILHLHGDGALRRTISGAQRIDARSVGQRIRLPEPAANAAAHPQGKSRRLPCSIPPPTYAPRCWSRASS